MRLIALGTREDLMALRHIQSDKVLSLNSTQATAEGVGNVVSVDGVDLIAFGLEFFAPFRV